MSNTNIRQIAAPENVPPVVRHIVDGWPRYVAAFQAITSAVDGLRREYSGLIGGDAPYVWRLDFGRHDGARETLAAAREAITREARRCFCAGSDLALPECDAVSIARDCGAFKDADAPDFVGFWRALEARYGGDAGMALARSRAASELRRILGIWPDSANLRNRGLPIVERGGVTFTLYRMIDKAYSGGYKMRWDSRQLPEELGEHLRTLDPGGNWTVHCDLLFATRHDGFRPPVRVQSGDCRWTLFTDKTTLWMPQERALELRAKIEAADPVEAAA